MQAGAAVVHTFISKIIDMHRMHCVGSLYNTLIRQNISPVITISGISAIAYRSQNRYHIYYHYSYHYSVASHLHD